MKKSRVLFIAFFCFLFLCSSLNSSTGNLAQSSKKINRFNPNLYKAMKWRSIGPYRGGRSTAISGIPSKPYVYYFGGTGGGLWKTEDGGLNWRCVSDGFFKTGSVGAIAVSEWDPNVVYVGMGETQMRGNVSHGDGIYKSTDAGKTWTHIGLNDTSQIARVRIHPRDPDIVYVAALGHVYGPNEERGVFRTRDGGKTWEKILYRDAKTGAVDLILDASNPRIIYAALWEFYRTPHSLSSGGPGGGLFKSTDGGDTWTEISHKPGLPKGMLGKIGVTVSPAMPDRVWAIIEAKDGGVFRSEDGGQTWRRVNDERRLRQRAFYYTRIYANPKDADTVYVLNTGFYRSVDGGRTYTTIRVPHGDNHDLWIDPKNPHRMINANDGGANVTYNGGISWTDQDNQPTAQFYHVTTDNHFPYRVYGAQQDNSTVRIASRTVGAGIDKPDWHPVGGGESGHIAPRHDNPDIVYAGSYGGLITRWDYETRQTRIITAWPENPMGWGAAELKYRYQWTAPIVVSRFDSNVLYHAAQVLFKTTNEGQSWEIISPDLTTNDKERQKSSGGPITKDNTSVEYYCTIFALAESFHDPNTLWIGTDDGLVHITRDGGEKWENITPKDLPKWSLISMIELSTFNPGTAYLAVDCHELDDFKPYIYKTEDFGKSWKKITNGLPDNTFLRVVREDPKRKGLLYAGTETGVFVFFDDGKNWQPLQLNLPVVPIHDMVVKEDDLVVATHGRSFWILDDLTPLHQITDEIANLETFLFKPRDAYRMGGWGWPRPNVGQNPPGGSVIYYYLKEKPKDVVTLEFMDAEGNIIKKFTSRRREGAETGAVPSRFQRGRSQPVPAEEGMNRFIWNMRYSDAEHVPGAVLWGGMLNGPVAVPGVYQARLKVGEKIMTQSWEWKKDPRLSTTQGDFQEQFDFLIKIRDKITEVNRAINQLRDVKKQIDDLAKKIRSHEKGKEVIEAGMKLKKKLIAVEDVLIQSKSKSGQDPLNYPILLDNKIAALASVVSRAEARPTDGAYDVFKELFSKADEQLLKLKEILKTDLAAFNKTIKEADIPTILIKM
ncbi:MAG: glycosyl hydrolase [Candidatus Aminicenantes bacterium]|nr:MAG: glycosyl hydrolase [Candidatus Aminicenantes bacterium]UCC41481.1 MAG: glycosyl hydrolase [Candidatus Aminicenantes bacterium]